MLKCLLVLYSQPLPDESNWPLPGATAGWFHSGVSIPEDTDTCYDAHICTMGHLPPFPRHKPV